MKFVGGKDFKVDDLTPEQEIEQSKKWKEFLFKFWYSQGCRPEYTMYQNQEIAVNNLKKVLSRGNKNEIQSKAGRD